MCALDADWGDQLWLELPGAVGEWLVHPLPVLARQEDDLLQLLVRHLPVRVQELDEPGPDALDGRVVAAGQPRAQAPPHRSVRLSSRSRTRASPK